jgi:phosphonate transport system permease protein
MAKKLFFAFFTDLLIWSYLFLTGYEIFYKQVLVDEASPFQWNTLLYCLLAGGIASALLFSFAGFSLGKRIQKLYQSSPSSSFSQQPDMILLVFLVMVTLVSSAIVSKFSLEELLSERGISGAAKIFAAILSPNTAIFTKAIISAVETIYMAFLATCIAIPVSFVLSFFAARNLMKANPALRFTYSLVRLLLNFNRSIEPLVWAIIFSVWVGIGPFAGMLALMLHSVVSLAKLYSEEIENSDEGPIEAMKATGASPLLVIWYGIVPQVVVPFLSFTIYRWDINVRMATVIGLVGGGGIGTMLIQYQQIAKWNEVGMIVFVIAGIVWIMDYASAKIREAIQ